MRPPDEIIAIETTIQVPGGDPTKERFLRSGHIYVLQIGSGENCQVRNECLANLHASIEVHEQSAYITNHDRVAGTVVNGQRIHDRVKVRHGDEVKCGDVTLDISFVHPNLNGATVSPLSPETNAYHCNGCGGEWELHPNECTNRAHWDTYVGELGKGLVEKRRIEGEKNVEIEGLRVQIARLNEEVEALLSLVSEGDGRDFETFRKEQKSREMQFDAVVEISKEALEDVDIPEATAALAALSWTKALANQYRKVRNQLETLQAEKTGTSPEPSEQSADDVRIRSGRKNAPIHGREIEHYLTMVEGLLALRIVSELSQSTEAEIAVIHHHLWEQMTKADRSRLDGADGLIEQAKNHWKRMEKKS